MRARSANAFITQALGVALVAFGCLATAPSAKAVTWPISPFSASAPTAISSPSRNMANSTDPPALSNRFYIDTASDDFVGGSPIRVRLEEGGHRCGSARAGSAARREDHSGAVLAANAGFLAGYHAITDHSADPGRIVVRRAHTFRRRSRSSIQAGRGAGALAARLRKPGDVVGLRSSASIPPPAASQRSSTRTRRCHLARMPDGLSDRRGAVLRRQRSSAVLCGADRAPPSGVRGPDFRWLAFTGRL